MGIENAHRNEFLLQAAVKRHDAGVRRLEGRYSGRLFVIAIQGGMPTNGNSRIAYPTSTFLCHTIGLANPAQATIPFNERRPEIQCRSGRWHSHTPQWSLAEKRML